MANKPTTNILICFRSIVKDDSGRILLLKRNKAQRFHPEKWELPGGKLNTTDEISSFIESCLERETNLVIRHLSPKYYYQSRFVTESGKYHGFTYIEIASESKYLGGNLKIDSDHTHSAWVSKDDIFSYDLSTLTKNTLAQHFSDALSQIPIIISAKALVKNTQNKYLLIKRSLETNTNPGKWDLPGGKLDAFETLSESLKREVFEETNLVIKVTKPILHLYSHVINQGKYTGFSFLEIVSEATVSAGRTKLGSEHTEHRWVTQNELFDLPLSSHLSLPLTEIFLSV